MVQKGKIVGKNRDGYKIEVIRNSACSADCSSCKGCSHGSTSVMIDVKSQDSYHEGDIVSLKVESSFVIGLSYLTYIVPIITMIGGYAAAAGTFRETGGIIGAFLGLLLPIPLLVLLSRKLQKNLAKKIKIAGRYEN